MLLLCFIRCAGQSHDTVTVSINHNLWRGTVSWSGSPSAYQPDAFAAIRRANGFQLPVLPEERAILFLTLFAIWVWRPSFVPFFSHQYDFFPLWKLRSFGVHPICHCVQMFWSVSIVLIHDKINHSYLSCCLTKHFRLLRLCSTLHLCMRQFQFIVYYYYY